MRADLGERGVRAQRVHLLRAADGCPPGDGGQRNDSADPNSAWANCAPLSWEDLLVGKLDDKDGGLNLPNGGGTAWFYFELFFRRVKGSYFSNVQFGTQSRGAPLIAEGAASLAVREQTPLHGRFDCGNPQSVHPLDLCTPSVHPNLCTPKASNWRRRFSSHIHTRSCDEAHFRLVLAPDCAGLT